MTEVLERFKGCLLGLAIGDAIGTTLEFKPRGSFEPISDMVGGGPFQLKAGEWTDDTSMALCLAASLLYRHGFDATDQMNRYCNWRDVGYMSSNGRCFDIGITTSQALDRYLATGNPIAGNTHPRSAGNGSIMRLAPVVLFYFPNYADVDTYARESSRTTHGAEECLDACSILAEVICQGLRGDPRGSTLDQPATRTSSELLSALLLGSWKSKRISEIRGSGYVVESLEAALWCFFNTTTFRDCVLMAANLGDDADTTAAVAGQIAGAFYGVSSIPAHWLDCLAMAREIEFMAEALYEVSH